MKKLSLLLFFSVLFVAAQAQWVPCGISGPGYGPTGNSNPASCGERHHYSVPSGANCGCTGGFWEWTFGNSTTSVSSLTSSSSFPVQIFDVTGTLIATVSHASGSSIAITWECLPCVGNSRMEDLFLCGASDAMEIVRIECATPPPAPCYAVVDMCEGDDEKQCIKFSGLGDCSGCYCVDVTLADGSTSSAIVSVPDNQFAYLCFDQNITSMTVRNTNCDNLCRSGSVINPKPTPIDDEPGRNRTAPSTQSSGSADNMESIKKEKSEAGENKELNVKIFPNPTFGLVNVEIESDEHTAKLYDAKGSLVKEVIQLKRGKNRIDINSNSNFYILIISDKAGNIVKSEKIIVNK